MRNALKQHNKVFQYMELEKEEHGMANEETRYRVYGAIETFLRRYNPPQ
jgi:dipeptidyl aminopeptidase/acylaminoacyl peptidase